MSEKDGLAALAELIDGLPPGERDALRERFAQGVADRLAEQAPGLVDASSIDWDAAAGAYAAKAFDDLAAARPDLAEKLEGSGSWEKLVGLSALMGAEKAADEGFQEAGPVAMEDGEAPRAELEVEEYLVSTAKRLLREGVCWSLVGVLAAACGIGLAVKLGSTIGVIWAAFALAAFAFPACCFLCAGINELGYRQLVFMKAHPELRHSRNRGGVLEGVAYLLSSCGVLALAAGLLFAGGKVGGWVALPLVIAACSFVLPGVLLAVKGCRVLKGEEGRWRF